MNVESTSAIRSCTSCQICGAVCPTDAISIVIDENGFYRPVVSNQKCIDCSLCVRCCYKFDNEIQCGPDSGKGQLYAAWAKDTGIVDSTTSGGIADLLAASLIEKGYKCIGVSYDTTENIALSKIAFSKEEILSFRGSKYIQAYTLKAFKHLVKNHSKQRYAIFGLPCHIYAIDRFLTFRKDRTNHILIDLYCHGCPSINLWKKYVGGVIQKTQGNMVASVDFRSKARGWGRFCVSMEIIGDKGRVKYLSPKSGDSFYTMFFSDCVLNEACQDCKLRGSLEYPDIRLGDFWGDKFLSNNRGVSGITVCTERGMAIFEDIKGEISFSQESFSSFLPYQSYGKTYSVNLKTRQGLLNQLADPNITLHDVVYSYKRSLSFKGRVVLTLKNFAQLFPDPLITLLKRIVYHIKKR